MKQEVTVLVDLPDPPKNFEWEVVIEKNPKAQAGWVAGDSLTDMNITEFSGRWNYAFRPVRTHHDTGIPIDLRDVNMDGLEKVVYLGLCSTRDATLGENEKYMHTYRDRWIDGQGGYYTAHRLIATMMPPPEPKRTLGDLRDIAKDAGHDIIFMEFMHPDATCSIEDDGSIFCGHGYLIITFEMTYEIVTEEDEYGDVCLFVKHGDTYDLHPIKIVKDMTDCY